MAHRDSKARFSNRVQDYVRYRPTYPPQVLAFLRERLGLTPAWRVADVGSGTGISSRLFLENGNEVFAVEPNADMRSAAEQWLAGFERFHSVPGAAEATTLPDRSVEMVVCAQAYHWFDKPAAATEFRRILVPGGHVGVIWNERKTDATPFLRDYENVLRTYGTDYEQVAQRPQTDVADFSRIFGTPFELVTFANEQLFDLDGFLGRARSSSYTPAPGERNHEPMLAALRELFGKHQQAGRVRFEYRTELFWGAM